MAKPRKHNRHQHLTLLLIPHDRDKVGEYHLSRPFLRVLGVFLVIYVGAVCFYGVGYYRKAYRSMLTDRLQVENEDLKRQLAGIRNDLDLAEIHVAQLAETDRMMRAWTNTPGLGDDVRRLGVGGGAEEVAGWAPEVSPATARLLGETAVALDQLQRQTEFLHASFNSFSEALSKDDRVRRHTPSIAPVQPGSRFYYSSGYGYRTEPFTGRREFHNGIDLAGRLGDDVIATADGVVRSTGKDRRLGYFVTIDHGQTYRTVYGHLRGMPPVSTGHQVKRGEVVGKLGSTGRSTGPHVHYSVFLNNQSQNPLNFIFGGRSSF